jgi:hypothetical protein
MPRACRWCRSMAPPKPARSPCTSRPGTPCARSARPAASANCQLRLVDSQGADVKPGATGEIWIQGDNVMSGYWQAPQATAAVLVDGWFHSGDMGHLDEEGYLYVDGRSKDMIISGGENIYPAEIENLLIESPRHRRSLGHRPARPRWGEIVVAVVVPKENRTAQQRTGNETAGRPHRPLQASQGSRRSSKPCRKPRWARFARKTCATWSRADKQQCKHGAHPWHLRSESTSAAPSPTSSSPATTPSRRFSNRCPRPSDPSIAVVNGLTDIAAQHEPAA